jgi:hypothetical protein
MEGKSKEARTAANSSILDELRQDDASTRLIVDLFFRVSRKEKAVTRSTRRRHSRPTSAKLKPTHLSLPVNLFILKHHPFAFVFANTIRRHNLTD